MEHTKKRVIITGGGASGMAAAFRAAEKGAEVILLEQNEKLGKKVFITGKGRCNVTNAADIETILNHTVTNRRFLYSALYGFTNEDVMNLLQDNGCPLKVERGNRVFPVSDKSSDVIRAFERALRKKQVEIRLRTEVTGICTETDPLTGESRITGVNVKNCDGIRRKETLPCDALILATGGVSYPSTGSSGDGHRFSQELGHTVTPLLPALVPFETEETWVTGLSGLSLKNIEVCVMNGKKVLHREFGEMLFTHFGVSGPVILSASSVSAKALASGRLNLLIDLKPALTADELDARILRDFEKEKNRQFKNSLSGLLPEKLISVVVRLSEIPEEKRVNEITREERKKLVSILKALPLTIKGTRGFTEAIITQGGVSVKEVNPSTMESKKVRGLYFAGELLDIDAFTGGYNLQLAWSTGWLSGDSAAEGV